MTDSGKLFADELTNWLIKEEGLYQSLCQISIYYKCAPDGFKLVVLHYIDDFIYWYKYKELRNWFMNTLGNRFHVNLI